MANLVYTWELYEQDVIKVIKPWHILSFAYKWLGEKTVHAFSLPDFSGYNKNKEDDKAICLRLWKLFNEASVVIAHNGTQFDVKKSMARFLVHGLPPPKPFKQVDTRVIAKKYFRFNSNKLDSLGEMLGIGKKLSTGGFDLWLGCARGDKKAWKIMVEYNKQDVVLLEKVYLKMLPYIQGHPNFNVLNGTSEQCPNCGGDTQRRGFAVNRVAKLQRFQCKECGAWSSKPLKGVLR